MFVQFCREWHCWHRAVVFAPWVTCYMALEENTQGAHFVLQALSHFFLWERMPTTGEGEGSSRTCLPEHTVHWFQCRTTRLVLASHGQVEVEKNKNKNWLSDFLWKNTARNSWMFWIYKAVSCVGNVLNPDHRVASQTPHAHALGLAKFTWQGGLHRPLMP